MSALQIALILIGILLFIGSFFVSEKLSSSDIEEIKRLSEQEIKIITERTLSSATDEIEERLGLTLDEKIEELERRVDKETNQQLLSIGEYSDTVLSSMNTSHDEIIFLYDMLNDKQEKITTLTKDLQKMESELLQLGEAVEDKIGEVQALLEKQITLTKPSNTNDFEEPISIEEALREKSKLDESQSAPSNDEIIKLYKEGMSEVEIAKTLGRGLGEVKLILGLFSKEHEA